MKPTPIILATVALAVGAWSLLNPTTQAAQKLLPFQGRLTDASGAPVSDGAKVVQFKIYDAPTGGTAVWNGEVQKLTVNGGLVSTLLGSKANLSNVDFNVPLYLEITVDAQPAGQPGNGTIDASDPPLLPRQSILPAVFAAEAADSRMLGGYRVDQLPSNVPVGGVIMWWGARNAIPASFEVCNGAAPTTVGATFNGNKPDLEGRFVSGALAAATDVQSNPVLGGLASTPTLNLTTAGTALTSTQMPNHSHSITDKPHSHPIVAYDSGPGPGGGIAIQLSKGGSGNYASQDAMTGITATNSAGGGQPHDHGFTIPPVENRPPFLSMFFIIRVK